MTVVIPCDHCGTYKDKYVARTVAGSTTDGTDLFIYYIFAQYIYYVHTMCSIIPTKCHALGMRLALWGVISSSHGSLISRLTKVLLTNVI